LFLATGYWLLITGYWVLVTGCWLLVTDHWLLVSGYWALVAGHWVLIAGHLLRLLVAGWPFDAFRGSKPFPHDSNKPDIIFDPKP